jgi:hypothetical protein
MQQQARRCSIADTGFPSPPFIRISLLIHPRFIVFCYLSKTLQTTWEANVRKQSYWRRGLGSAIALAACLVFLAGAASTALAQTPPELEFLNNSLALRAEHGDQEAHEACPSQFSRDVETATATVFVLLSGNEEATSIEFLPEVPAAGSEVPAAGNEGLSRSSYNQLVTENRLIVQAEAAKNEQPGLSIKPSEVKAFTLRFLICSNSEAPGWWYYVGNTSIPVEWSNFAGQLVVRDSDNA